VGRHIFVRISYLGNCLSPLNENVIDSPSGIAISKDSEGANRFFFLHGFPVFCFPFSLTLM